MAFYDAQQNAIANRGLSQQNDQSRRLQQAAQLMMDPAFAQILAMFAPYAGRVGVNPFRLGGEQSDKENPAAQNLQFALDSLAGGGRGGFGTPFAESALQSFATAQYPQSPLYDPNNPLALDPSIGRVPVPIVSGPNAGGTFLPPLPPGTGEPLYNPISGNFQSNPINRPAGATIDAVDYITGAPNQISYPTATTALPRTIETQTTPDPYVADPFAIPGYIPNVGPTQPIVQPLPVIDQNALLAALSTGIQGVIDNNQTVAAAPTSTTTTYAAPTRTTSTTPTTSTSGGTISPYPTRTGTTSYSSYPVRR